MNEMFESCLEKQNHIKELFAGCRDEEAKYGKIIELGKNLRKLHTDLQIKENLVDGCQSQLYLHTELRDDKLFFEADSDALISAGLAYLLITVYSGETPETVLKCPPTFLEELEISSSLTPNRANGLYSLHLRMKQEALKCLVK